MFIELLKFEKEAKNLDNTGLIKQANKVDSRINRLSYFLSHLHEFNISDSLHKRLIYAKDLYDKYEKQAAFEEPIDEENTGESTDGEVDTEEEDSDVPKKKKTKSEDTDFGKEILLPNWLSAIKEGEISIDFDNSILSSRFPYDDRTGQPDTSDRRYFLDLTSARILDENQELDVNAWKDNPNGVVIYFIAFPEKENSLNVQKKILLDQYRSYGDFSMISKQQALDIINYYKRSGNRRMFPGMCLDIFAQLLLKTKGKESSDEIINSLSEEEAKMELFGGGDGEYKGRFSPLYESINKAGTKKTGGVSAATAQKSLMGFLTDKSINKVIEQMQNGKSSQILSHMLATALKSTEMEFKSISKQKPKYNISDDRRWLVGGDNFGRFLATRLKELASDLGISLDSTTVMPKELMDLIYNRWNFTSLASGPFASLADNSIIQNRFILTNKYKSLIKEVVDEENEAKSKDNDYIEYFTEKSFESIIGEFQSLGMLNRYSQFQVDQSEKSEQERVLKLIVKKRTIYDAEMKNYYESGGKGKMPELDIDEELEIMSRQTEYYYTLSIDQKTGRLSFKEDILFILAANDEKTKLAIRQLGEDISRHKGIESLNRDMCDEMANIALDYSHPEYDTSAQTPTGEEGKGTILDMQQDKGAKTQEEMNEDFDKAEAEKKKMELNKGKPVEVEKEMSDKEYEAIALIILKHLSRSKRRLVGDLGFTSAFNGDIGKYIAIVKDMYKRLPKKKKKMRKKDLGEINGVYGPDGNVADSVWLDSVIADYGNGNPIEVINIPKEGDVTAFFVNDDKRYIIDSRPRTVQQIKQDESSRRALEDGDSEAILALRMKAQKWMRQFTPSDTKTLSSYAQFNIEDPDGKDKEDKNGVEKRREIIRSIIMDDAFHDRFISYMEAEVAKNPKWTLMSGLYLQLPSRKADGGMNDGQDFTNKAFREGRLLGYLFSVCGLTASMGVFIIQEGATNLILGAYLKVISKFYKQLSPDCEYSQAEIDEAILIKLYWDQFDENGMAFRPIKANYEKPVKGPEGLARSHLISNRDGIEDVDNIIYLASQSFESSRNLKNAQMGIFKGSVTPKISHQRAKAKYLMRMKYIMDAFRYWTIGQAEINSVFKSATRTEDSLASAKTAYGDFSSKIAKLKSATQKILDSFYEDIKEMPEGDAIRDRARAALAQIGSSKVSENSDQVSEDSDQASEDEVPQIDSVKKTKTKTKAKKPETIYEQYEFYSASNIARLQLETLEDFAEYFKRYKIGEESIQVPTPQNALDIYNKYRQYIAERYSESRPYLVHELDTKFSGLPTNESGEFEIDGMANSRRFMEVFSNDVNEKRRILEEYVRDGKKKEVTETKPVDEVTEDKDTAQPIIDKTLDTKKEEKPVAPVAPVMAPRPQSPVVVRPTVSPVGSLDPATRERMQKARELSNKHQRDAGIISLKDPDIELFRSLGFVIKQSKLPGYVQVSSPPEYMQYMAELRRENAQNMSRRTMKNIEKFVTFADSEIDMILDSYGV